MLKSTALLKLFRRRLTPTDSAVPDEEPRRPAPPYPVGRWRCIHARDHLAEYFTPGETYLARLDPGSTDVRIDHGKEAVWAPTFDHEADRFRHEARDLQFEYVGAD